MNPVVPGGSASQVPAVPQIVEQQSAPLLQCAPIDAQIVVEQWPVTQLPVQHSAPEAQVAGGGLQAPLDVVAPGVSQTPCALHTPLQQLLPVRVQAAPWAVQVVPMPVDPSPPIVEPSPPAEPSPPEPSPRPPSPPPGIAWSEQLQP
jgi:hypothetical protein